MKRSPEDESKRLEEMSAYERQYALTCRSICGIDEAGRGPLAGPVVAAAVILPQDSTTPACVCKSYNPFFRIDKKYRGTVGIVSNKGYVFFVCYECVNTLNISGTCYSCSAVIGSYFPYKCMMVLCRSNKSIEVKACGITEDFIILYYVFVFISTVERKVHRCKLTCAYTSEPC